MTLDASKITINKIYSDNSGCCLVKVIDYVWADVKGLNTKFWVYQAGFVADGKFKADSYSSSVEICTASSFVSNFTKEWEPKAVFGDGDIVVSGDGKLWLTKGEGQNQRFWKLERDNMSYGTRDYVERTYGTLRLNKTVSLESATNTNLRNF